MDPTALLLLHRARWARARTAAFELIFQENTVLDSFGEWVPVLVVEWTEETRRCWPQVKYQGGIVMSKISKYKLDQAQTQRLSILSLTRGKWIKRSLSRIVDAFCCTFLRFTASSIASIPKNIFSRRKQCDWWISFNADRPFCYCRFLYGCSVLPSFTHEHQQHTLQCYRVIIIIEPSIFLAS